MGTGKKDCCCCFSGHRELSVEQLENLRKRLKSEVIKLINAGVDTFISGCANGFDTEAALTVNELKQEYLNIKLVLVLPYRREISIPHDECICLAETYRKGCFHIRNRYMVDNSSYCICYLAENKGGTAYTVNYAKRQGLKIINVALNDKK